MRDVLISSDSTCDLSEKIIKDNNIAIMPLHISLDDKDYRDGVDIKPDFIYKTFEEKGILPKTSAPNLAEYYKHFTYLGDDADIIHISLSSSISSSYQNAILASGDLDNVFVIDSSNLSTGSGFLVLKALDLIKEGFSVSEIVEKLEETKRRIDTSFVLDTLEYLREGGRCSSLAAIGANLLKIRPSIIVDNKDGNMTVGKKYRGQTDGVLLKYINDKLEDISSIDKKRIIITHSGISQEILDIVENEIKSKEYFNEILITRAGCTISSHCGENTLGIIFEICS